MLMRVDDRIGCDTLCRPSTRMRMTLAKAMIVASIAVLGNLGVVAAESAAADGVATAAVSHDGSAEGAIELAPSLGLSLILASTRRLPWSPRGPPGPEGQPPSSAGWCKATSAGW